MARQVRISDDVADEIDRRIARGGSLSAAADDLLRWALAEVDFPGETPPAPARPVDRPVDGQVAARAGKARTSRSAMRNSFAGLTRIRR